MQRNAFQYSIVITLIGCLLAACNSSNNNDNSGDTINVAAPPQNLTAIAGTNQITLSWDAVEGATAYKIYWSLEPNVSKSSGVVIEGAESAHDHRNLTARVNHYYVVVAIDANGEGLPSAEVVAMPAGTLLPANFSDNNLNNCIQSLIIQNEWQYSEDVTGILDCSYRGITNIAGLQQFTQLEGINLSNNTIKNLVSFQSFANLKTLDLSNNNLGKQDSDVIDSLTTFKKLSSLSIAGNPQLPCVDLDVLLTVYGALISDVSSIQTGINCTSYTPNGTTPAVPPLQTWPTGVVAVPGNNKVTLNWSDAIGATAYRIYWSNQTGVTPASANLIDNVFSGYVHRGLTNFSSYYYVITAMINGIESAHSKEVTAIPSDQGVSLAGLFSDASLQSCVDAIITPKAWTFAHELTTSLDCSSKGITSLSGLENLTALKKLNLSNNNISDISSLQPLTQLRSLFLNNNGVVDISPLSYLGALSVLNLRNNTIIDVSPLNSLNTLTELYLGNNQIVNVAPIGSQSNIVTVDLRNNSIGGEGVGHVNSLAALTKAKQILISGNEDIACSELQTVVNSLGPNIIDIAPQKNTINCSGIPNTPTNIRVVPGDQKNIVSWTGVIGARNYNVYWASAPNVNTLTSNKISGVSPGFIHSALSNGTAYYYIVTAENAAGESQPSAEVSANPNLVLLAGLFKDKNLQLCVDELATLHNWTTADEVTGLLNCSYQNIQDIGGIEKLEGLTRLSLNTNSIYDLSPIANLSGLKTLSLYDNIIQDVSVVAGLVNLTDIFISGNKVSNVQALANLPNVNALDLRDNTIGVASVGHVDSLANLINITEIQIQKNPTMSCPELANLLANARSGVVDIRSAQPGVNCSDPALVPSNLNVVAGDGQLTINWDVIEGVPEFYLYWSAAPTIDIGTANRITVAGNSHVHTNLTNDTTYYYVVTSKIGAGESAKSEEIAGIPSPLGVSLSGLFPDSNLSACVNKLAAPNGWTLSHEISGTLNCSSNNIANLTGIGYLTSLQVLRLGSNKISDISSLASLSNLEFLDLYNNQIVDISAIGDLTALKTLYLHNNNITNAGPLSGLPVLQYLILDENAITDSTPIASILSLTDLFYRNNGVTNISGFSQLTQLVSLYLNNNQVSDVGSIGSLVLLKEVDLRSNRIAGAGVGKIDAMSSLLNVSQIWLSGNANIACSELSRLVDAIGPAAVDVGLPLPGVNCVD